MSLPSRLPSDPKTWRSYAGGQFLPSSVDLSDANVSYAEVSAPVNIAAIKYWGKRNSSLILPTNSSLSLTLSQADLCTHTIVVVAPSSMVPSSAGDRIWLNGSERAADLDHNPRMKTVLTAIKARHHRRAVDAEKITVHVWTTNNFPTAAGLASSASGFAALVVALAHALGVKEAFPGEYSAWARRGSGSACRSLYGGFVKWVRGGHQEVEDGADSVAVQVCDEGNVRFCKVSASRSILAGGSSSSFETPSSSSSKNDEQSVEKKDEKLHVLVLVVHDGKKETSSTAGMETTVQTSELMGRRAEIADARVARMETAIATGDFNLFAELTMRDSNQFHAVALDTYPPISYMNDTSRRVVALVSRLNAHGVALDGEIRAAYSFDAGPNAVLFVREQHLAQVAALVAHAFPPPAPSHPGAGEAETEYVRTRNAEVRATFEHGAKQWATPAGWSSEEMPDRIHGLLRYIIHTVPGPGPVVYQAKFE
nr:diphosphomevalonate decarboxylase [Andalucia godoyi]|eukprot:ANDGO_06273.mRNA.1 Diphosphomevalonate decarboxylase